MASIWQYVWQMYGTHTFYSLILWQMYGNRYGKCMAAAAMCGVLPERKTRIFRVYKNMCGKCFMLFWIYQTQRAGTMNRQ